jgi:hypothetical protein
MDRDALGIYLFEERAGKNYSAQPVFVEFREITEGEILPQAFMELRAKDAQSFFQGLCDELSRLGYRPNTDLIAGRYEAQSKHLDREQLQHDRLFGLLKHTMEQALLPPSERR